MNVLFVKGILLLLFCLSLFVRSVAQKDSVAFLPNRLAVSKLKQPDKRQILDSTGIISITCLIQKDSLIQQRDRSLTGKLVSFTDSSLVLHVREETITSLFRNRETSTFYYSITQDSLKMHIDTIYFNQIHSLSFDTGRNRQIIRLLQSITYTYVAGNLVALAVMFFYPKPNMNLTPARTLLNVSIFGFSAGAASYIFYPKTFELNNHPGKHKRMKWRMEVI